MKNINLSFSEFQKSSYRDWQKEASRQLNGDDPNISLRWSSIPEIQLKAYYEAQDLANIEYIRHFFLDLERKPWIQYEIVKIINEPEANTHAKTALMNGCDGVFFEGNFNSVHLDILLEGINPEHCFLAFRHTGSGTCKPSSPGERWRGFGQQFSVPGKGFRDRFFTIESTAGVAFIDEPAALVRTLIDECSMGDPHELFTKLVIEVKTGSDFFHEIARLRALRLLIGKISQKYEVQDTPVHLHAAPLPGANEGDHLLRQTTSGLAAIIGGADSIAFHPGQANWAGNGAHRVSRNIGNLLRHESKLDLSGDIANGSYFIDSLTDKLARSIWETAIGNG